MSRLATKRVIVILLSQLAILSFAPMSMAQPVQFPYEVVVFERTATVYSGPGDVHYPCDRISVGKRLEVYRHDPDGWLAVRPPAGSFSLVPAEVVSRTDEPGVGTIRVEGTKAWVGTRLDSPTMPLCQIRLRQGERVEVIGQLTSTGNDGNRIDWLKIAPPAGEFRWVRAREVTRFEPIDVSSHEGASSVVEAFPSAPAVALNSRPTESSRDDQSSAPIATENGRRIEEGVPQATRVRTQFSGDNEREMDGSSIMLVGSEGNELGPAEPRLLDEAGEVRTTVIRNGSSDSSANEQRRSPDGFVARPPRDPEEQSPLRRLDENQITNSENPNEQTEQNDSSTGWEAADASQHRGNISSGDSVRALEIELTKMVALPMEHWSFDELHLKVARLQAGSSARDEQARVERLIQKLNQFETLQRRQLALVNTIQDASPLGSGVSLDPSLPVDVQQAASTYAGTGYLNRLVTQHGLGPGGYVLQDEHGKIINIVTPSPGVNLERYLEKHVALQGKKGPHARFDKPLILADRVILLERHR